MRNLIDFINEGLINLDNYSASPRWVGFFETNNILDHSEAFKRAISIVKDFLVDSEVYGSCHFFGDVNKFQKDYNISQSHVENIIIPLLSKDLIRSYNHYSECDSIRKLSSTDFHFKEMLCLTIMDVGVKGHLFFFDKTTRLIVYPHDDVGFGLIGTSVESELIAKQFLEIILKERYWSGRFRL